MNNAKNGKMQGRAVNSIRSAAVLRAILVMGAILCCSGAAQAQLPPLARQALGFLNAGGYFFSNGSANSALGTPKFYNSGGFFTKAAHLGPVAVRGGLETVNASDHFIPFTGGNEFNLLGGAVHLSTDLHRGRISPFVDLGLYAGRIRSVSQNFDRTEFTPSASIGAELPVSRDFSIVASYRISQQIHGVNTDGFSVSLRVF